MRNQKKNVKERLIVGRKGTTEKDQMGWNNWRQIEHNAYS